MKIAVAMIVKNAEDTIGRLLDSLVGRGVDRIVFVDTGSTDKTKEIIASFIDGPGNELLAGWVSSEPQKPGAHSKAVIIAPGAAVPPTIEWVLADYGWHDDFAAARNFSFTLAEYAGEGDPFREWEGAEWIGYLDADDEIAYRGKDPKGSAFSLKRQIEDIVSRDPKVNCITMGYQYVKDLEFQEKLRFFKKGATEWYFEDEVHEYPLPRGRERVIGKMHDDAVVLHNTDAEKQRRSFERNTRIIKAVLARGDASFEKQARMLYHLGVSLRGNGDAFEADRMHQEVERSLADTTMWIYSRRERVMLRLSMMRNESIAPDRDPALIEAVELAGGMATRMPTLKDGHDMAGWAQTVRKRYGEAAACFDQSARLEQLPMMSIEDQWVTDGVLPACRALSYAVVGRIDEARAHLAKVNPALRQHDVVYELYVEADRIIMKTLGLQRTIALTEYLIWDTQPTEALKVLMNAPAAVRDLPIIAEKKRWLSRKLGHLKSYKDYCEHYASIPAQTYHSENDRHVLGTERATQLFQWVKKQPKDGPPIYILSIGSQDGIIEDEVLSQNERFHLTLVDVAPQASKAMETLINRYPGRAKRHVMRQPDRHPNLVDALNNVNAANGLAHYDWSDDVYDVITCFEVIEHLPQDTTALFELRRRLKPDGRLFLSTPVADRWVEPYLTDEKEGRSPPAAPPWYGHVRAHSSTSLWHLLRKYDFVGDIVEGRDGTQVFQGGRDKRKKSDSSHHIEIVVPGTPTPFDGVSPENGFLGGSEEAVVRLARALIKEGADVTVYSPSKMRDGARLAVTDSVLWRDIIEFDAGAERNVGDAVLMWRCPQGLKQYEKHVESIGDKMNYRVLLWLHDAEYGAQRADYECADAILTLSEHHRRCLVDGDDAPSDSMVQFGNGIDAVDFPVPNEDERNEHRVIYASSPERGLEHLLDMWPAVRAAVPTATLEIFYDWTFARERHRELIDRLSQKVYDQRDHGVTYRGGVDQPTLHRAMREASVMAYCNEGNVETYCITALKALASGCWVVATDAGALPEVVKVGDIIKQGEWEVFQKRLIEALEIPVNPETRARARAVALEQTWEARAKQLLTMCGSGQD